MARASTLNRLQRLDYITSRLKSDEPTTVGDIAEELGISTRTLYRDIEVLRETGVPVEAERGRGGGVRLHRSWGVGRINLSYQEAVDLLISLAIADRMGSAIFLANLTPIRLKLMASFSPTMKEKLRTLKSRILVGQSASLAVLSGFSGGRGTAIANLHQAFLVMRRLRIRYRSEKGEATTRTVEPHYLLLNYPVWYVLCWDELRQDIRTFRCDRIETAKIIDAGFSLQSLSRFQRALEGVEAITP